MIVIDNTGVLNVVSIDTNQKKIDIINVMKTKVRNGLAFSLAIAGAKALPVGSGGKCHFKLGMNGKLLSLSISNGLILYVR